MGKIFIVLIAVTIAFAAAGVWFYFMKWPDFFSDGNLVRYDGLTTEGARWAEFQTLIGSYFAALAALIAGLSVYASTAIPHMLSERKGALKAQSQTIIASIVLADAVVKLRSEATVAITEYLKSEGRSIPTVIVPDVLRDLSLISTQSVEVARGIASIETLLLPFNHRLQKDQVEFEEMESRYFDLDKADIVLEALYAELISVTDPTLGDELRTKATQRDEKSKS